jgi:hypothetical protein
MSAVAAAVKGTSNNKQEKASHNSMPERHDYSPINDVSRSWARRTIFFWGRTNERYATMYIGSRKKTICIVDIYPDIVWQIRFDFLLQ